MDYRGIITPLITPARRNTVDFESIEFLLDFLRGAGVEGVFPGSSTGGFTLFSTRLHGKILEFVSERVKGGILLLAGISRNNIDETIEMGRLAINAGYHAAVVITPFYLKFGQEHLFNYYSRIAESLDIDIFIYNNPELSGNFIEVETISRLMEKYSNIVGVKDSSGDMRNFNLYFTDLPNKRLIFQGRDDLLYPSIIMGASGGVCGTSNFSPLVHQVYTEMDRNKHLRLVNAMKILRKFNNTVSYNYLFYKMVKKIETDDYALEPYTPLKENEKMEIERVIDIIKP